MEYWSHQQTYVSTVFGDLSFAPGGGLFRRDTHNNTRCSAYTSDPPGAGSHQATKATKVYGGYGGYFNIQRPSGDSGEHQV